MNENDADFWLFTTKEISKDALINMYSAMDDLDIVQIEGSRDELVKFSLGLDSDFSVVVWRDPDETSFFLHTMEEETFHRMFNGRRQLWLTIREDLSTTIYEKERKNDFTPVFKTICEHVCPFFAFGGLNTLMSSDIWYFEAFNDPLERLFSVLCEFSGFEFRTMFFDSSLYDSIPKDTISSWGELDDDFGPSGHLVSCRKDHWDFSPRAYNDVESGKNKIFKECILPHIRRRFVEEYLSIEQRESNADDCSK